MTRKTETKASTCNRLARTLEVAFCTLPLIATHETQCLNSVKNPWDIKTLLPLPSLLFVVVEVFILLSSSSRLEPLRRLVFLKQVLPEKAGRLCETGRIDTNKTAEKKSRILFKK